jgi:hypothetical protein
MFHLNDEKAGPKSIRSNNFNFFFFAMVNTPTPRGIIQTCSGLFGGPLDFVTFLSFFVPVNRASCPQVQLPKNAIIMGDFRNFCPMVDQTFHLTPFSTSNFDHCCSKEIFLVSPRSWN